MWLIGSLGVDRRKLNAWRRLFHGGVFVEPHMPELREFREHFLGELQVINWPMVVTHQSPFMGEDSYQHYTEKATRQCTDLRDRMQISFLRPWRDRAFFTSDTQGTLST